MPSRTAPAEGEKSSAAHVLFEAGFLAGALVDHVHGCLPSDITPTMRSKVIACFDALVDLSRKIMEIGAFEWHDVCLARRILNRVMRAISPGAHRHALGLGLTPVPVEEIAALNTSLHRLNAHILRRSDEVMRTALRYTHQGTNESDDVEHDDLFKDGLMTWTGFTSVYEAAIINRTRGDVSKSLEQLESLTRCLKQKEFGLTPPTPNHGISGLTSFFPTTLSNDSEVAAEMLLGLSMAISRRSRFARAMGMTELQEKENDHFLTIARRLLDILTKEEEHIHVHGLLHLENVFRVCVYQAAWSVTRTHEMEGFTTYNKTGLSVLTLLVYYHLDQRVSASTGVEPWMKTLMRTTFEQNKGVLISEIAPEIINETSEGTPEISKQLENAQQYESFDVFRKELWRSITQSGWQYEVDRPAYLKSEFRRMAIEDLVTRSKSITSDDSHEILIKLRRWLGDPTSLNATGKKNSATMAAQIERIDEEADSLHLSHLPQGGINRAQAAVGMAYMQSIMRASHNASSSDRHEHEDTGAFHALSHLFVSKKDGEGVLRMTSDPIPGKLQFSMKHQVLAPELGLTEVEGRLRELDQATSDLGASFSNKEMSNFRQEYRNIRRSYSRANLTRVNRQDSLMFIAKALGDLHEVLEDQLGSIDLQQRIDRAARQCRIDEDIYLPNVKPPHVHELLYLAIDAANSPLRLLDLKYTEAADADEDAQRQVAIDALLRASMARLHALSIRTEITARILLEKPLREPYQSSAVLLTDQIRVLLRFFHTDWQSARDVHPSTTAHSFSQQIAYGLNLFKNERRKRTIQDLEIPDLIHEEIRNEPAVSYTIEYGTSNPEQSRTLMVSSKDRLNFEAGDAWGTMWKDLLAESITLHHETLDLDALEDLQAMMGGMDGENEVTAFPTKQEAAERAMKVLERKTTREWILWARLATFPVCFVGRSLVSGTTTKDLNMSVVGRMAKPMLFNTVREAFCTEQE